MYKGIKLSEERQSKVVSHVEDCFSSWKDMMADYRTRMTDVYEGYSTFKVQKKKKRHTDFKVNKAHEVVNKILPKLMAKGPTWIVTPRTDVFDEGDDKLTEQERLAKMEAVNLYVKAIADYLKYTFSQQDLKEVVRLRAKSMIIYGIGRAKACYKYNISRDIEYEEEAELDESGTTTRRVRSKTSEKVAGETPTIEVKKRSDIYYDPRYVRIDDMPGIIDVTTGLRLSYFTKRKNKYINVDKLVDIANATQLDTMDAYAREVERIAGITPKDSSKVDINNLTVKTFYGLYDLENDDGSTEKLYEFTVVAGLILVSAKEITQIPYEDIKCFEDPENHYATGFVEPILGLQDELNFKKNAASHYTNQSLYRNFIWSPNSGINPKRVADLGPGDMIPTSADGETALKNFIELPHRPLPPEYFQEQNDFERQIQAATFTVDTTTPEGNQALTNTATGIKVKFYESNSVVEEVRRHFEEGLERLGYKLLQIVYESADENIVIKKLDDEGFWEINKEAFKDAMRRYEFKIETGSSTFDSVEQRRNDAIARFNISLQAQAGGVPVDLAEQYKSVMETFEGVDTSKLLKPVTAMPMPTQRQPLQVPQQPQQPLPV